jgi:hypothetical protein
VFLSIELFTAPPVRKACIITHQAEILKLIALFAFFFLIDAKWVYIKCFSLTEMEVL